MIGAYVYRGNANGNVPVQRNWRRWNHPRQGSSCPIYVERHSWSSTTVFKAGLHRRSSAIQTFERLDGSLVGSFRFALAIVVLFGHSGMPVPSIGGTAAVEAFFLISGAFMAAAYRRHYSLLSNAGLRFWVSRYLRLWPSYALLLFLTFLDFKLFGDRTEGTILGFFRTDERPLWIDVSVFTLIGQDVASVFIEFHRLLPIRQAWSVSAELVFYALVPFLFRATPRLLLAIVISSLFLKVVVQAQIPSFQQQIAGLSFDGLAIEGWRLEYFPFWNGFFYFCLGFYGRTLGEKAKVLSAARAADLKPLALVAFLIAAFFPQTASWFGAPGNNIWFDIMVFFIVLNFFDAPDSKLERLLGSLAYHVYLAHYLAIELVNQTLATELMRAGPYFGHVAITLTVVLLSTAYAFVFDEFAQKRIDRWRLKFFKKAT